MNSSPNRITTTANSFLELNVNTVIGGGGILPGSIPVAFPLNYAVEEDRRNIFFRHRGSNNVIFQSRYNRKFLDGVSNGYERGIEIAYSALLREGLDQVPPGTPLVRYYQLENSTVTKVTTN